MWLLVCVSLVLIVLSRLHASMKSWLADQASAAPPKGRFGWGSTAEQVTEGLPASCSSNLTAIITGATSGIGAETARVLAKRGVRLVIPARDLKRADDLKKMIIKESPQAEILVSHMDLSSLNSVRRFCSHFLSLGLPLNILINNAGIYCSRFEQTEDNFETTFATNYLGHFLLTETLLEKMIATSQQSGIEGRIINVSSVIHNWVKEGLQLHDQLFPKHFSGTRAYAQSKLANIMHIKEVAKQLKNKQSRVTANSVHPGIVKTRIIRVHKGFLTDLMFFLATKFLKSLAQGASTTCYVALSPRVKGISGKYFADCHMCRCSSLANDENESVTLWEQTRQLIVDVTEQKQVQNCSIT